MGFSKLFIVFCVFSVLCALPVDSLHGDDSSEGIQTGENWIQNRQAKVTVEGRNVSVHMKDSDTGGWNRLSSGQLIGLLAPPELMKPYREKYGGYYLFGKESAVEVIRAEIRDGSPVIKYRTSLEDLWIDTEIRILGESGFVLIETVDRSIDALVSHWVQNFHQTWASGSWWMPAMTHLVFDDPSGSEPKSMAAVDYRDIHKFPVSARYCVAYRPGTDRVWGFFWPPKDGKPSGSRRIQFPPGAIVNAYLDEPYVIFAEVTEEEKNQETMNSLGERMYKQLCSFFDKKE
jgi:hypothetical protein